jgi:hypothetical protein
MNGIKRVFLTPDGYVTERVFFAARDRAVDKGAVDIPLKRCARGVAISGSSAVIDAQARSN